MKAVLLVSHGSYASKVKEEAVQLASILKSKTGIKIFEIAFLEIEAPDINRGIDICVHQGASEVLVLLNFLNSGRHVQKDIPSIIKESQTKYPNLQLKVSLPVGQHPNIQEIFIDMIHST